MALTLKQRKFIEAYTGNGTDAARAAGYAGNDVTLAAVASENLRKPQIAQALEARAVKTIRRLVASREERQTFWTRVMDGEVEDLQFDEPRPARLTDRLKASELLGRSEADFTENLHHKGDVHICVVDPYAVKPGV